MPFSRHARCSTSNTVSPGCTVTDAAGRIQPSAGRISRMPGSSSSRWARAVWQEMERVQVSFFSAGVWEGAADGAGVLFGSAGVLPAGLSAVSPFSGDGETAGLSPALSPESFSRRSGSPEEALWFSEESRFSEKIEFSEKIRLSSGEVPFSERAGSGESLCPPCPSIHQTPMSTARITGTAHSAILYVLQNRRSFSIVPFPLCNRAKGPCGHTAPSPLFSVTPGGLSGA